MDKKLENFKQINLDAALQLGGLLERARIASGQEVKDIANQLTLSKKQITGLELVDFSSFISSTYYFLAAKKYAMHLKLDFNFDRLLNSEAELPPIYSDIPAQRKTSSHKSEKEMAKKKSSHKKWIISALALPLLFVFVSKAITYQSEIVDTQKIINKPTQSEPPSPQSSSISDQPSQNEANSSVATETPSIQTDNNEIRLDISDNTWIQIVYQNDEKIQKTYTAGETINLKRSELRGLVIGNVNAVKLFASNKEQDISIYVASGSNVAKIFGQKLRSIGI